MAQNQVSLDRFKSLVNNLLERLPEYEAQNEHQHYFHEAVVNNVRSFVFEDGELDDVVEQFRNIAQGMKDHIAEHHLPGDTYVDTYDDMISEILELANMAAFANALEAENAENGENAENSNQEGGYRRRRKHRRRMTRRHKKHTMKHRHGKKHHRKSQKSRRSRRVSRHRRA